MTSPNPHRVSIIGAALSANKGAAAMVETVIARLPETLGPCSFDLLTTYPADDVNRVPHGVDVRVVGLQPMRLATVEFPLALLACLARCLRLPTKWVRSRACRSILDSQVVVDVAGISFVDGRGLPITVYNAMMTGLPLLLGTPTVKAAQALGPFHSQPNRLLARMVLPRLYRVCARGAGTKEHLDSLGITNVEEVADLAFSLVEAGELPAAVDSTLSGLNSGFILVMPSAVVRGLRESSGHDYVHEVASLIRCVRSDTGRPVVIAPHSYRVGRPEGRMNDGPVCRDVAAACGDDRGVVIIDADLTAGQLRSLVHRSDVLVTSRFHAMISGLATCVPTIVVGWSHKYREVLADFGLEKMGLDADSLGNPGRVSALVMDALQNHEEISARITSALPAVRSRSERNFEIIAAATR